MAVIPPAGVDAPMPAQRLFLHTGPGAAPAWLLEFGRALLAAHPNLNLQDAGAELPATAVAGNTYGVGLAPPAAPNPDDAAVGARVAPAPIDLWFDRSAVPPAASPREVWALSSMDGAALTGRWALLRAIVQRQGVQLLLWRRAAGSVQWRCARTVHLAAPANPVRANAVVCQAAVKLVTSALNEWRLHGNLSAQGAATAHGLALAGAAPPAALGFWAAQCLVWQGACRAWCDRQRGRWLSEFWRIGVIDAPIATLLNAQPLPIRWITQAQPQGYWADPFGVPGEANRMYCEYFDETCGVGHLESLTLDADNRTVHRARLQTDVDGHLSFPMVVEMDGRRLAVAESVEAGDCILQEVMPDGHWRVLFPLLRGVPAADPALFKWEGRYWLAVTDVTQGAFDNLCLYFADQLEGPWQPHALNPVKVDVTGARMAGGVFTHEGQLYRPAQNCLRSYGAGVVIHRIERLTPQAFEETPVRWITPDPNGPCPDGIHTVTAWGDRILVDGKRHGLNTVALRRKFSRRFSAPARPALGLAGASTVLAAVGAGLHAQSPVASAASPDDDAAADPHAFAETMIHAYDDSSIHVAVYVPHLRTGGGELSMLRLAEGFAQAGLQVDLVVHDHSPQDLAVPAGVRLVNLQCKGSLGAVRSLARWLRSARPAVLLSAFPHTNVVAVAAVRLSGAGTRAVLSEHAPVSQQILREGGWRYRSLPPLLRWAYRRADAVVAVSHGVAQDLKTLIGPDFEPLVIANPVLPPDLAQQAEELPQHPWLLDPQLEVVLTVSRLSVEKDLPTVLRAFADVRARRPQARLLMAGEGPDRERIQAQIDQWGLGQYAQMPGRVARPFGWMSRAKVFVLASQFEGFGNVLVEAMACGTPVVSTDCPVGPREILQDGRLGALVAVGDTDAMAKAILSVLIYGAPQAQAAQQAALQYSYAASSRTYGALFQRLLQGPARAGRPAATPGKAGFSQASPRPALPSPAPAAVAVAAPAAAALAATSAAPSTTAAAAAEPVAAATSPKRSHGKLISHTLRYLPAQLLAPAAQLLSMILWTHWLAPSEMGLYTLATVTQEIAFVLCLGWFSTYALRYMPPQSDTEGLRRYLQTENSVVLFSTVAGVVVAVVTAWSLHDGRPLWQSTLPIAAFFVTRATNLHYAERARAQSSFTAYTILQTMGPVGGLALGWLAFQYFEATALVLLSAYALAQALGTLLALPMLGMQWRLTRPDPALLRSAIAFGAPLLGLGVLGWVAENYIRYLVQWQAGASALGLMIVGWSLGRRCASVASMLVATAAFPLASRLLNEGRRDEALAQLRVNAALMVAVLVPVTAALELLGTALVTLTVAQEYRQLTSELLGLSVLAGTFRNLHMHITDQLMVLERRFKMVTVIDVVEIVACLGASLLGYHLWQLHGAVIGQALGSVITLGLSVYLARTRLGFIWPGIETLKILAATALMVGALLWLDPSATRGGLIGGTLLATVVYVLAMAVLFAPAIRHFLAHRK